MEGHRIKMSYLRRMPLILSRQSSQTVLMSAKPVRSLLYLMFRGLEYQPAFRWNLAVDAANPQAFKTKTLEAEETISIIDDLIGSDTNLIGATLAHLWVITLTVISAPSPTVRRLLRQPFRLRQPDARRERAPMLRLLKEAGLQSAGGISHHNDMHLTANNSYFMNGTVFVGENDLNTPMQKGQADNRSWH